MRGAALALNLEQEQELIEMRQGGSTEGPQVADSGSCEHMFCSSSWLELEQVERGMAAVVVEGIRKSPEDTIGRAEKGALRP